MEIQDTISPKQVKSGSSSTGNLRQLHETAAALTPNTMSKPPSQVQLKKDSMKASARSVRSLLDPQQLDLGPCPSHPNRQLEAYCEQCNVLVCPSCIMFGDHKQHPVIPPDESAVILREMLDIAVKSGKFKPDYTEKFLLDIRAQKQNSRDLQFQVLDNVQQIFDDLIKVLKKRRDQVKEEVKQHFEDQFKVLEQEEVRWNEKQRICTQLLKLANEQEEAVLVKNSRKIVEGLENLNEPLQTQKLELVISIDNAFRITKTTEPDIQIPMAELMTSLGKYGQLGEIKNV